MTRVRKAKSSRAPVGRKISGGSAGQAAQRNGWAAQRDAWVAPRNGRAAERATAELFPMFLKIADRPCLVVGAGPIAESKIESLVRCGASVRVVAPDATDAIREAAKAGRIVWEQRRFRKSDLRGMWLVVAATSSPELHEQIFRQAQRAGILCNAVDEPPRCDFYYPAVVRRGPLQIAVSTGGRAPSLAQRLRQELERYFVPEYGPWTEAIGRARSALMASKASAAHRKSAMRRLSSARAFETFRKRALAASHSGAAPERTGE